MEPDVIEDLREVSLPLVQVVPDPDHHGLVDLLLRLHITFSTSEEMRSISWGLGSWRNSSFFTTSWKLSRENSAAIPSLLFTSLELE